MLGKKYQNAIDKVVYRMRKKWHLAKSAQLLAILNSSIFVFLLYNTFCKKSIALFTNDVKRVIGKYAI